MSDDAYESCEWIEGGLAFNRRSLHSCLIVHHHTGLPFVADYNGGEIPLETLFAVREQIRAANRSGTTHHECRGCPHLKRSAWPRLQYPVEIVGIAHYSYCNIKCSYCFLQTQDPSSFASGYKPYSLLPVIRNLISDGHLAPHAIIDWGGGEPTSYPEFDQLLELLLAYGTFHYIHTNGTRFPPSLRRAADPGRVHVICSLDAGLPETYRRIKQKDYLERVWGVLKEYTEVGASVTLKYIVKEENRGNADLEAFATRAGWLQPRGVIVDFDYDFPNPGPAVIAAMGRLRALVQANGIPARFGFTGLNFAPEHGIEALADAAFRDEQVRIGRPDGPPRHQSRGLSSRVRSHVRRLWDVTAGMDGVAWLGHNLPAQWLAGGLFSATVHLRNDGSRRWPHGDPNGSRVELAVFVDGSLQRTVPLPHDLSAGQDTTFTFDLKFPTTTASVAEVKIALLEPDIRWLEKSGAEPLIIRVRMHPSKVVIPTAPATEEYFDAAPQAQSDKTAGLGRRLWNLPIVSRSSQVGE